MKKVVKNVKEDIKNFNKNNKKEDVVFKANYFSSYKGMIVIKTPFDRSFSYGIIGLSKEWQTSNTLNHEYGHGVQMKKRGIVNYTTQVAIPSVTISALDQMDKLPYEYYGAPWEAEADKFGNVNRTDENTPWPEDAYTSYYDLIKLFWE